MLSIWTAQQVEYRDHLGIDRHIEVDLWVDVGGLKAVLVLRGLPFTAYPEAHSDHSDSDRAGRQQACAALRALTQEWLPFLLRPHAQVLVLGLRPRAGGAKAHALVLPLSA